MENPSASSRGPVAELQAAGFEVELCGGCIYATLRNPTRHAYISYEGLAEAHEQGVVTAYALENLLRGMGGSKA